MAAPQTQTQRDTKQHDQHRVLTIRGKSYCNSACVFCVEKFTSYHPVAPKMDETRQLIEQGRGKYNMLFFMNGEPSLHPKLFDYVSFARENGFEFFGMSSHFRAFADPHFARKVLAAGFEFFDISLHAATLESQEKVNPIGDGGASLREALHGLRNVVEIAKRDQRRVGITHKMVITQNNVRDLHAIFLSTYRLGVRNFILQPVKASGMDAGLSASLAINEDEFMPHVNELLRKTEGMGAEIKLYGMSRIGVVESQSLVSETNLVRHVFGKRNLKPMLDLRRGDQLVPTETVVSDAAVHEVTVHLPDGSDSATFSCREDQFILNAALSAGVGLPFGCRMGSCAMCVGKLVEGQVDRAEQIILTDAQMEAGYTLLCSSRPRSKVVIITHQDTELGI